MDFIIADINKNELGYLKKYERLDIEINDAIISQEVATEGEKTSVINTFELEVDSINRERQKINDNFFLHYPETEYGGRFEKVNTKTNDINEIWGGTTWRGLLDQDIIRPPTGSDYRTVSGDANQILRNLLPVNNGSGSFFTVMPETSGITINNYQFERYTTMLNGFTKMLKTVNAKLKIWTTEGGAGEPFSVMIGAVPIYDYSAEIEYSDDVLAEISITLDRTGITHLITLGQGELRDRQIYELWLNAEGKIVEANPNIYIGVNEKTAVYDFGSAEDMTALKEEALKKFEELTQKKTMDLTNYEGVTADIGDIISGRDRRTGISLKKPIIGKILRSEKGINTIETKIEGSNS